MDFGFSEEQEMLRQSARALLEKECPSTVVRKLMDDERGFDPALWKKMAELGWLGLVIPEEYGGGGLSYVDLVLIMEEMGRVGLPSPFIWTVMVAEALKRAGSDHHKSSLLPKIASGELVATVAYLEPSAVWSAEGIAMTARNEGAGSMVPSCLSMTAISRIACWSPHALGGAGKAGSRCLRWKVNAPESLSRGSPRWIRRASWPSSNSAELSWMRPTLLVKLAADGRYCQRLSTAAK